MKVYFLSSLPCALRVNNLFFGTTNLFERFAELSLKDGLFIEFVPEGRQAVSFFLTEQIRFTPPKGCEVYLLKEGLAIYARDFPPSDFSLRVIAQAREENTLATLFFQGELQLSIERDNQLFIATLPPSFANSELFFESGLLFVKTSERFAVYTKSAKLLLSEKALSLSVESGILHALLPLSDNGNRVAECEWALSETECTRLKCAVSASEKEFVSPRSFAYSFFESVLIGANYTEFLADELIDKADGLIGFLGDFVGVIPTDEENVCGLIRKKSENLFEAAYYTVKIEKNKIFDITT
ncbi:MAG: hypothetical protein IJY05_03710 [Clostridia bacterium]|nr:hypothetical protein [Clostridia bacterium]